MNSEPFFRHGRKGLGPARLVTGLLVGLFVPFLCLADVQRRSLSLEERVRAQEAIERVYYAHQIGASLSFEEAVPHAVIEKKVRIYLKQSAALETLWKTPVTAEMLRKEL